jgi:hypothetical protein
MSLKWAIEVLRKIADSVASLPVWDKDGNSVNWSLQEIWTENRGRKEIEQVIFLPFYDCSVNSHQQP